MKQTGRSSFKCSIGFILAAAGSAVGLGNIWRFPYLAAKDGGGLFLLVYLILAFTFGFTLLTSDISIGRKTKQSPLTAYTSLKKGWKPLGVVASMVTPIILPYYCVIGGWVIKYLIAFLIGDGMTAATDGYFTGFITGQIEPFIYTAIFLLLVSVLVYLGVKKGIEASSKIIMPILVVLVIGIAIYSLTLSHTEAGVTRTGLEGFTVLVVPNFEGMTFSKFINVVVDAMGQLFYSLSVAMGIMVTYGSYVPDDTNLVKSINRIEIFDTLIAFLAGVMIIPTVFVFMGTDGLDASGPGLMFISLPMVFASMGPIVGRVLGIMFFAMVLFAALTSAVSVMENIVSNIEDQFHVSRHKATIGEGLFAMALAVVVCLGYNAWYFEVNIPTANGVQILDIMDYVSNNVLMPIVAIATCILIGWVVKPKTVTDELTKNGEKFKRKGLYTVMVKFIAPVLLFILFLRSIGVF